MAFVDRIESKKVCAFICLLGFILNLIAYYPGFLSPDGLDQYQQSTTNIYNDWHPPIMAALWHVFDLIHKGPLLMLLFQLSLFWISIYLLLPSIKGGLWKALIIIVSLAPFIQNFVGYIVKDIEMSLAWLLASIIMFRPMLQTRKLSITEAVLSFLLILYATWIRQNALPGSIPFCFLWAWLVLRADNNVRKFSLAIIVVAFLALAQFPFNYKIMKAEKTYPELKLYLQDITGTYVKTGESFYTPYLFTTPAFDTNLLRIAYDPATFDDLWTSNNGQELLPNISDDNVKELRLSWGKSILKHPAVYLSNRMDGFIYYLRIKNRNPFHYYYPYIDANIYGFTHHDNVISQIFLKPVAFQKDLFYMQPWCWFILSLVLFLFIPRFRNKIYKQYYVVLLLSNLLYFLPQFFIYQTDTDFRYFYWHCVACSVSICILIADRRKLLPAINTKK